MTIEEMFEKLWWSYPNDLCKGKKGGKQPALKALKKINPDEKEFKRIMLSLEAMKKADRKDKDAYRWAFVSSWLNQARYDDAMPEMRDEVHEVKDEKICKIDGCKQFVLGPNYTVCSVHVPSRMDDRLRAAWLKTGLDRNASDFGTKCREYCRSRGWQI